MELTDKDTANIERARKVGAELGYVLNPDIERTLKVSSLLAKNFAEHGKYYCPCKQSHPLDPAKDVLCPCPTLKDEVAKDGHCVCRLFFKPGALGAALSAGNGARP
ncbi:MAG: ferredoxin:thioredoxin reductase [candidate division WOR-3 bacterium]|nr:ferredoxin:thioredoxin reductase [candidate division WOR-3 bacterium]